MQIKRNNMKKYYLEDQWEMIKWTCFWLGMVFVICVGIWICNKCASYKQSQAGYYNNQADKQFIQDICGIQGEDYLWSTVMHKIKDCIKAEFHNGYEAGRESK